MSSNTLELDHDAEGDLELFHDVEGGTASDAPTALTHPAYELAQDLAKLGALNEPVELPSSMDRSPLTELRRKAVVKIIGGTRGRPGRISLLKPPERLVLSQRRRATAASGGNSSRPTIVRTRPTVEDLRSLVDTIEETERELFEKLSAERNELIAALKRQLVEAGPGSDEERELFERLTAEMQRLRLIESEIRIEALKRIESARGPLAAFTALISRERPAN